MSRASERRHHESGHSGSKPACFCSDGFSGFRRDLGWGSKAGEESAVVFKSGLDTSSAVIKLRQDSDDAERYCDYYLNADDIPKCVANTLENPAEETFTANCLTGEFSRFAGTHMQFLGPADKYTGDLKVPEYPPEYLIQGEAGSILNDTSASGYSVVFEIFRALCPSRFR